MPEQLPDPQFDPPILHEIENAAEQFNTGKFFECHDTLEEIWQGIRGSSRDFLQGLIQVSVGFYHLSNGNNRGAASQLEKALKNLQGYGDSFSGMELERLRQEVQVWLDRIHAGERLHGSLADLPKFRFKGESKW